MASWKVAPALEVLRAQIDAAAPRRSKRSDGSIGDAAHASRTSDHNPWLEMSGQRWVTARDFTHDVGGGLDCRRLGAALQAARDVRVKYVIWDRRIMSGAGGARPWTWRPYSGPNPHTQHLHLSVVADQRCLLVGPWTLAGISPPLRPVVQLGSTGEAVRVLQAAVGAAVDGVFGPDTMERVRAFQRRHGLVADGVVGPKTWAIISSRAAA
jgi:hypothetical protein